MADDNTNTRKGVLLPMQISDKGGIRGMYIDEHGIQPRQLSPVKPGEPIMTDEVVSLSKREGTPFLDAEVTTLGCGGMAPMEASETGHDGPCRVNSKAYQNGWERIFGSKDKEIPEA